MMKNITIIAILFLCFTAFAQKEKSKHSGQNGKVMTQNESKNVHQKNDFKQESNSHFGKMEHKSPKGNHDKSSFSPKPKNQIFIVQQGKGKGKGNHGGKSNKSFQPQHGKKMKGNPSHGKHDKRYDGKPGKVKFEKGHSKNFNRMLVVKGHPNFGYLYVNTPGYYGYRNYGQYRSSQARKKHKKYHPVYEYQAVEGFNFIIVRNNFLYTETNSKINQVRIRLSEKRKADQITIVEYDNTMREVLILEKRRAALEINISL
jgi:hypothetical protein